MDAMTDDEVRDMMNRQRFEEIGFEIYLDGARDFESILETLIHQEYDDYSLPQEIIDKAMRIFEERAR